MIDTRTLLLAEIDAFLHRVGMSDSALGKDALNDPAWVMRFRAGLDPRIGTVDQIRRFMAGYKPPVRPKQRADARAVA